MTLVRTFAAVIAALCVLSPPLAAQSLPLDTIRLPAGFTIDVLARAPGVRQMAFGANGTLFAGSVGGRVYAITYDATGQWPPKVRTIATDLREPAGVAFRDGSLYVSAVSRIVRFDDIERRLDNPPQPVLVSDKFPTDGQHAANSLRSGPTVSCTYRSARHATSASPIRTATQTSCE